MENGNKYNHFIKILYDLKNRKENPFKVDDSQKFTNISQNKLFNFFGTYEDLFGEVRCPICLSRVKTPKRPIDCKHIFCSFCLKKWMKNSNTCPVCRIPIKNIISVDLSEKWVSFQGNLYPKYL